MNLPLRTVKYVVRGAIQQMGIETPMREAPDGVYDDVFNTYIDMLISWQDQDIVSGLDIPSNIDFPLSASVPAQDLIYMLLQYSAGKYQISLTPLQAGGYSKAWEALIERQVVPSIACNPVPSGYAYYNRYPVECGCDEPKKDLCIETEDADDITL